MINWRDTRVLVGGGSGCLGWYLLPRLVEEGATVTVVDNLENGDTDALAAVMSDISFVKADLRERAVTENVMRGHDIFINLAAKASGVGFSRSHHGEMLVDNVLCGLVPLQA